MAAITAEDFRILACQMLNVNPNRVPREVVKAITGFFGTSVEVMADIWNRIDPIQNVHTDSEPKHLLWALLFLYHYNTEKVNCKIVGIGDPKTFRNWCWRFVAACVDGKF